MPQFLHSGRLSVTGVAFSLLCFSGCLILAASASGQVPADPSPQAANPPGRYTLSGTVINSATGEGIAHALVEITVGTGRAMLTGLDGRFEFPDVPESDVTVSARKPGFFTEQELSPSLAVRPVIAKVGPESSPVVVKLIPQAVITGHIESAGMPLEGISVKILASRIQEGRKRLEQRSTTASDEDGNFRVSGLTPGTYYVEAGPGLEFGGQIEAHPDEELVAESAVQSKQKKEAASQAEKEQGYPAVFYPAAPDMSAATAVDVGAGDQATANFSLRTVPARTLSGVIVGLPPSHDVFLSLESTSGEEVSIREQYRFRDGKFTLRVPAGEYILRARAMTADKEPLQARVPLDVTTDIAGIRLVLAPQPFIPVEVSLERAGGTAVSITGRAGGGYLSGSWGQLEFSLVSRDRPLGNGRYSVSGGRDDAGLAIRGIEPGTYSAEFTARRPWHVQSAVSGSTDLLRDDLTVVAGAQPPPIEIVLRDDSATLNGTITSDGEPVTAAVVAVRQGAPRQPVVTVGRAGSPFEFENLSPGDYSVFAVDRLDNLAYADPEAIEPYLAKATHVTLEPGQKASINLEVLKAGN